MNQYEWMAMSAEQRRKAIEREIERCEKKDDGWYDDDDLVPTGQKQEMT